MKKYIVAIEETVAEEFEVEANDFNEALGVAAEKYFKGVFALSSGEVHFKQMAVLKPHCESTEWREF